MKSTQMQLYRRYFTLKIINFGLKARNRYMKIVIFLLESKIFILQRRDFLIKIIHNNFPPYGLS